MSRLMARMGARAAALAVAVMVAAPAAAAAASPPIPIPIPIPNPTVLPPAAFLGHVAARRPIRGIGRFPQSPFMAANGRSEIHNDEWQSDVFTWGGPLGRSPRTFSTYLGADAPPGIGRDCGSIAFDRRGRVISICIGLSGPKLYMFDPRTLATLATFTLPPRTAEDLALNPGTKIFQDFSAGGYFYLNRHDEVVTGTTSGDIDVIREAAGPSFQLVRAYPLGLRADEEITSQLPDSHGLVWFTARRDGVVGTLNLRSGRVHVLRLGRGADGEITKSLAADPRGGIYIPTNRKLYRFTAARGGRPRISWQVRYANDGVAKPGQLDAGTGTTPVLAGGGRYVGINDNTDPMDVTIYRTAVGARRRLVCRVPVFHKGASAGENAMIGAGRAYVIENNYGYAGPQTTVAGPSTPGFARIDITRHGCRRTWTSYAAAAPSVVSKLSLANGLIYTYTNDGNDNWYWTTLSFRTGRIVYQQYAGSGVGYNNNYAGIALSPSGTEYLGTLGGLVALRDAP